MDFIGTVVVVVQTGPGDLTCDYASSFLRRGASVVLNKLPGQLDVSQLQHHKLITTGYPLYKLAKTVGAAISEFGKVDVLAIHVPRQSGPVADHGSWNSQREDDFKAVFRCVKEVWPLFRKQTKGRLIFSSISTPATLGLLGFANTLNIEGTKYNIGTTVASPETPLYVADESKPQSTCSNISLAATVTYLSSDALKVASGSLFLVSDNGVRQMRWARPSGLTLNPDYGFSPDAITARWSEVSDFSTFEYPNGPLDSTQVLPQAQGLPPNKNHTDIRFDGKVAIVTGGAQGLGRAYAVALAKLGASVAVNDLSDPSEAVREITDAGGKACGIRTSSESGAEVVSKTLQAFGRVDILINNAGFLRDKAVVNMEEWQWDAVLGVHLNGTYQMTKAVWPYFVQQGGGSIVNTSSTSGIYGKFGQANYSLGKLGIVGITQETARQGESHGIRVNVIAPFATTGGLAVAWEKRDEKNKNVIMKPEYVAPLVLFLCSDTFAGCPNTITGRLFETGCGWQAETRLLEVAKITPDKIRESQNASRL